MVNFFSIFLWKVGSVESVELYLSKLNIKGAGVITKESNKNFIKNLEFVTIGKGIME